ncbi:MAG TPA: hypothetical protein VF605_14780 [Allosphingosinicella sp.]|jgi:hypothetical protein
MQTERVTFLTSRTGKAAIAKRAAAQGVSMGEYVRRKVEDEDELTAEQEAELAALVAQANEAIPKMRESLDRSIDIIESTRREVDAMLREAGLRK